VRRVLLVAGTLSLIAGCAALGGAGYVMRAGWSEARILLRRRPIAELLARPDLDPTLRARLSLAIAVRDFAAGPLGLSVGDSYTTFADVDREATVWVLSAARRDRLEAHTWWYPVVGRAPYRGFFDRDAAEAAGRELGAQDLDVEVRPAVAFSTLGWFADPLLSTAAAGPPVGVAETIIHELFHATLYVPGATAFNESAATFAGHRGAAAFFCPGGPGADAATCRDARRRWASTLARARILGRLATHLRRLYAAAPAPAVRERARGRLAAVAAAALVRRGLGRRDELVPPNNARLLGELLYATDLDRFDALAPGDGDVGPALAAVVGAARGSPDPAAAVAVLARRAERSYHAASCSGGLPPQMPRASASRPTGCSAGWHAGCASSATTSPTALT
jgi:predicted aminopeptidase